MPEPTIADLVKEIAAREQLEMDAPPEEDEDTLKALRWAVLAGGNGLDAASTEIALRRPGTRETNPLMRGGPAARGAIKAGTTVAAGLLFDKLAKKHPTLANILGIGTGAALGVVGARNLRQGQ